MPPNMAAASLLLKGFHTRYSILVVSPTVPLASYREIIFNLFWAQIVRFPQNKRGYLYKNYYLHGDFLLAVYCLPGYEVFSNESIFSTTRNKHTYIIIEGIMRTLSISHI